MQHFQNSAKAWGIRSGMIGLGALLCFAPAMAEDAPNYADMFKKNAIKCVHPTANLEKATAEISKPAETTGDITTVRIKAFYEGLIKKNSMEADLMIRKSGTIRQMKIKVLSDTGTALSSCDLEKNWKDF